MGPFKVTDMPALTLDAQSQLTTIESQYHSMLSGHCHGHVISDPNGALEKIRTFATVFFDFFYSFYSQFPAHSANWRIAAETKAVERICVQIEDFSATRNWVNASIVLTIKQTVIDHAKRKLHVEPIKPALSGPNVPTLLGNSDPPFVKLVKAIQFLNQDASRRQAFVQPLLDAKGWSIAEWAEKAKVSRHTAQDYMNAKRKTNHSNRRQLANALGVSFQDFPK